jgi:Ser/Thr protein kinase RdoA (MazF antagonist)
MLPPVSDTAFFLRLSPERVLKAVEAAGLEPSGHCFSLNALENRVYDVRLEDGQHVVAKFYRPGRWGRAAIEAEHAVLARLDAAEIPVCAPLRFPDGETLGETDGIFHALWPRTGGRSPDELDDAQVAVLGRLMARIHNVMAECALPDRPRLTSADYALRALAELEASDIIPRPFQGRYHEAVTQIASRYDALAQDIALQPIHGDCHMGNLLFGDAGWFFLDFDDMLTGPPVHDVWMLLPGRDAEAARQRALLVEAYRTFRDFDARSLDLVEPLRAFRFVWYAGWIARRWTDPAFPDAFPHFGTEDYWRNETQDLEDQLALIERGGGGDMSDGTPVPSGQGEDAESELTNADFFWDL